MLTIKGVVNTFALRQSEWAAPLKIIFFNEIALSIEYIFHIWD
jgi:hypothetical protein